LQLPGKIAANQQQPNSEGIMHMSETKHHNEPAAAAHVDLAARSAGSGRSLPGIKCDLGNEEGRDPDSFVIRGK
jgi:hypothetical protein